MKTLHFALFSALLLASNLVFSQAWDRAPIYVQFLGKTYNKAYFVYENGKTKYCYAAIPKTCGQNTISYKEDADAPVKEIPSQLLSEITILNPDSTVYIFERVNTLIKSDGKPKEKEWLYVEVKGYASLYLRIDKYKIDPQGTLLLIAQDQLVMYYVKKKKDQNAILMAYQNPYPGANTVVGANKPLKTNGPAFFAEHKEVVSKIKDGTYTSKDIQEIVDIYNNFMDEK